MSVDSIVSTVAALLGGFILIYGICSLVIKEKLYLSEASIAVLCGVIIGPIGFGLININDWEFKDELTRQFTRLVIAIQVMATGVALPKAYLRTELKSLLVLLGPVMIYMWMISGLGVWYFIPGLTFLESLMIASCFTPTDPILANSIVQGHFAENHVPENIRNMIAAESGANDGLGYPFLFLAIYLIQIPSIGEALSVWTLHVMIYEILLSIVIGFVAGFMAKNMLRFAEEKDWIDKESFLVYAVALALFLMGTVGLLGSDDLLACFIAGNAFTWDDWFRIKTKSSNIAEVVDLLLNLSVFIYIGITIPWAAFIELGIFNLLCLAIAVILLRRLPIIIALYKYIPAIDNFKQAVFAGWFGPIGVGALFYYSIAVPEFSDEASYAITVIEPVIYFMILASVLVHGITIPAFYLGSVVTQTVFKSKTNNSDDTLREDTCFVVKVPYYDDTLSVTQHTSSQMTNDDH